jgi:hypothetical protein
MSSFHEETWCPLWSTSTVLTGMYSFMVESTPTLGSIETTDAKKRQLAAESLKWNVKNDPQFCKLFPEYVERYEEEAKELLEKGANAAAVNSLVALGQEGFANIPLAAALAGLFALFSIAMAYLFF